MAEEADILTFAAKLRCQELHMFTDEETGLKAVIAIHNTNLGPALGGCRCIEYDSTTAAVIDAIRLAEGMSCKSAVANLPLGGGKSVLLKPKNLTDRTKYFEAFGRCLEKLNGRYITAVDSGTSIEDMDIIHTQTSHVTSKSKTDYSNADPSPFTALGVLSGIRAAVNFKLKKQDLAGIHVAIQGLGHVGYTLAQYLHEAGAKLSVFDINNEVVEDCVNNFNATKMATSEDLFKLDCDVLAPCALGAIINQDSLQTIKAPIIAGAANNQLAKPSDSKIIQEKDILYAPDFVINAGGIIYVAGEYTKKSEADTVAQIKDIENVLMNVFERAARENQCTFDIARTVAMEKIYG